MLPIKPVHNSRLSVNKDRMLEILEQLKTCLKGTLKTIQDELDAQSIPAYKFFFSNIENLFATKILDFVVCAFSFNPFTLDYFSLGIVNL